MEFLEWRLRLEALMPPRNPIPRRRRPHKEFSTPRTRCNGMCANDQCYDRIDEQGPLRLGVWRWVARWCMSLLRAWLPTHQPAQPADLHRPRPASRERDRSLCSKTTRCLRRDWTVAHHGHLDQVPTHVRATHVQVDGTMRMTHHGRPLTYQGIVARPLRLVMPTRVPPWRRRLLPKRGPPTAAAIT